MRTCSGSFRVGLHSRRRGHRRAARGPGMPRAPRWAWLSRHWDLGPRYRGGHFQQCRVAAACLRHRPHSGIGCDRLRAGGRNALDPVTILFLACPWSLSGGRPGSGALARHLRCRAWADRWRPCCGSARVGSRAAGGDPRGLGAWLLGPIWRPTYPLLLPTMLAVAGLGFSPAPAQAARSGGLAAEPACGGAWVGRLSRLWSRRSCCRWSNRDRVGHRGSAWAGVLVLWWQLRAALRECGTDASLLGSGRAIRLVDITNLPRRDSR